MNNSISEIVEKLLKCKKLAVFCHVRPDGDALGGGLALKRYLEKAGKTVSMVCEDAPPEKLSFIPAMKEVVTELPQGDYDAFVCVDCADNTRTGVFSATFNRFKGATFNIDHHISNDGYAKYNFVEVCPASCQIISKIARSAGWETDEEIANLLMLGLITDSGNFTHQDVSAETFETAAYLRGKGADINRLNYELFTRQTKARALLFGKVMSRMRFLLDDRLALICISSADLEEVGADKSLTEGFVDFPLTVDGVEVAVSLLENKKGQYKASLRSKGKTDVNKVAAVYGGGGHILASGCMLFGSLEEVIDKLSYTVSQYL